MAYELVNRHPKTVICTLSNKTSITVKEGALVPTPEQEAAGITLELLRDFIKSTLLARSTPKDRMKAGVGPVPFRAQEVPTATVEVPIVAVEEEAAAVEPVREEKKEEAVVPQPKDIADTLRALKKRGEEKMSMAQAAIELQKISDRKCSSTARMKKVENPA
jgi:hypothetical protein